MASHFDDWARGVLHVKLALVALVFVLLGLHVARPRTRGLSLAMILVSLAIVWCGVDLAHP
jgi:hypothetical protein